MTEETYTPEEDVTEAGPDGIPRLVAAKGIPIPMAEAKRRGLVKEAKQTGPREIKSPFGDDEVGMRRSPDMLLSFEVVGQELTDRLTAAGYGSPAAVASATDEQLLAIDGVGPKTLEKLRAATTGAGQE